MLKRKKLCFSYKETWTPSNRYLGKGKIHYIEVTLDKDLHLDGSKEFHDPKDPAHEEE